MTSDIGREVLPIPERKHVGVTTYDAKDPDTHFPPIKELRPPKGAPNVLVILIDDVGFGASSAFGGTTSRQWSEIQSFPYHRFMFTDTPGFAYRSQPPLGRHGRHYRDGHFGARQQLSAPTRRRTAGRNAQAERIQHGPIR